MRGSNTDITNFRLNWKQAVYRTQRSTIMLRQPSYPPKSVRARMALHSSPTPNVRGRGEMHQVSMSVSPWPPHP
ncbi:hypothetical protein MRY87_10500 [bacterium]|nr:hypothetical protein [bacterium]